VIFQFIIISFASVNLISPPMSANDEQGSSSGWVWYTVQHLPLGTDKWWDKSVGRILFFWKLETILKTEARLLSSARGYFHCRMPWFHHDEAVGYVHLDDTKAGLSNQWQECLKWHAAFTTVPFLFISFARPAAMYFTDYVYVYTRMWLRTDGVWITVANK